MRISMVSEHASPLAALGGHDAGGQNVHVAALAAALARQGHQVEVCTRRDDPALPGTAVLPPGVVVHHIEAGPAEPVPKDELLPFMPQMGRALAEHWMRTRPDVVHAHFWMSGLASLVGAMGLCLPVVQTFHALGSVKRRHQGDADTSPACRVDIEKRLATEVDLVLATCRDEVRELVALGVPSRHVRVVPCGVDTDLFSPDGYAEERSSAPRLVVVGRLVERKGVDTAIEALARIPRAELVVAGGTGAGDEDAARLRSYAEELGVADRVELRGPVSRRDIPRLLRSANILVGVPWYEPFGMAPLEAMACGVPVVVSDVGGLRETVADGVHGLRVPPRDPEALASAVRGLLDDPAARRRMGEAGAERAALEYAWPQVARDTARYYDALVRSRPVDLRSRRHVGAAAAPAGVLR